MPRDLTEIICGTKYRLRIAGPNDKTKGKILLTILFENWYATVTLDKEQTLSLVADLIERSK